MTGRRLWLRRREQAVQRAVPLGLHSFDVPPPETARTPLRPWPTLRVHRSKYLRQDGTARWLWEVYAPLAGNCLEFGYSATYPGALAVGMAALEQASVAGSRP